MAAIPTINQAGLLPSLSVNQRSAINVSK